jgi:hypothetical protein
MAAPYHLLSAKQKIRQAADLPVHECLINEAWREQGIANVLLSRRQPNGLILFGVYLVDVFCLGLKNTCCNADFAPSRYRSELRDRRAEGSPSRPCSLSLAHLIVYGGIEFAAQFGFRPHEDFALSRHVLEDPSCIDPSERVEFGRDGQPFYISGPFDGFGTAATRALPGIDPDDAKFVYCGSELLPGGVAELPELPG